MGRHAYAAGRGTAPDHPGPAGGGCLGCLAVSRTARVLLCGGGGYLFLAFVLARVLQEDCGFHDLHFGTCATLPQALAALYGPWNLYNVMALVVLSPIFLGLAPVFELLARRKPR